MKLLLIFLFLCLVSGCGDLVDRSSEKVVEATIGAVKETIDNEACNADKAQFTMLRRIIGAQVNGSIKVSKAQLEAINFWFVENVSATYNDFYDEFYQINSEISAEFSRFADSSNDLINVEHYRKLIFRAFKSNLSSSEVEVFSALKNGKRTTYYGIGIMLNGYPVTSVETIYFCE